MHHKDNVDSKFAVKIYSKQKENDGGVRHFQQECQYLSKLDHPYIVRLGPYSDSGKLQTQSGGEMEIRYSVLELAESGNLLDYVMNKPMNELIVRFYFRQLLEATKYMHGQGVAHRDIKLENLLLDKDFNIKVSDFGFATDLKGSGASGLLFECKGTPGYMAPEMFSNKGYDGELTDVFALGVVLFALLLGRPPFYMADPANDEFYGRICRQEFAQFWQPWDELATFYGFEISSSFKELFQAMVTPFPQNRPRIDDIVQSEWVLGEAPQAEQLIDYMRVLADYLTQLKSGEQPTESQQEPEDINKMVDELDDLDVEAELNEDDLEASLELDSENDDDFEISDDEN